jgi:tRNA 2-thiouridine synthesizing protein A
MTTTLDCRGLSCPQPVLLVLNALKSDTDGEMIVLVDTDTSRENVTRAVTSQGWKVKNVAAEGEGYSMNIGKK